MSRERATGRGVRRPVVPATLAPALALGLVMLVGSAGVVLGASPSPTPQGNDPRSPGQGPGLVGDPMFAIGIVLAITVLTIVATLAYVKLRPPDPT